MLRVRAFTLLEVTVAGALLGLLMVIAINLLVPTMRASAAASTRARLQQQAVVALSWLSDDLARAKPAGIGIRSTPTVLAIQPAQDLSVEGELVWEPGLVVYFLDQERLYRRTWNPSRPPALSLALSTTVPTRPSAVDLLQLSTERDGEERLIAANVESLDVTHHGAGASVAGPIDLRLVVSDESLGARGRETQELSRTVALRLAP